MAETGKDINKARQLLEAGELVAIPTETVYGLAGNALNTQAVTRIFTVKGRPQFDPLIIHVPSLEEAQRYVQPIPTAAKDLAKAFWPGPLTLLLERKDIIPDLVTAGLPRVGIRCPDHELTRKLLGTLDFPLAAPSANPFGYVSPTTPQHVADQLGARIPYILDGGPCEIGIESTIVGFDNGMATVFRSGGLKLEDIENVVGKVELRITASANPKTPGQMQSHYAPRKKLVIGNLDELIASHRGETFAVLSFSRDYRERFQYVLSTTGRLDEAAHNLFSALRTLDALPIDIILTEFVPETGLGKAINDRLRRAAH
jgi:L-threonylcarbamoyladenylate synthase